LPVLLFRGATIAFSCRRQLARAFASRQWRSFAPDASHTTAPHNNASHLPRTIFPY